MAYFNRANDPEPPGKKWRFVAWKVVSILRNPAAITGLGALILGVGLLIVWSYNPVFTLMLLGGAFGMGLALDDLRKKRRNKNKMKSRHTAALIAVAGIFLAAGLLSLLESAPMPTIMALMGAAITGIGLNQLLTRRRKPVR